jgi:hypothetical protein
VHATGSRDVTSSMKLPAGARLDRAILRRVGDTVELALHGLRSNRRLRAALGRIPTGFRPAHHQSLVTADQDFRHVRVAVDGASSAGVSAAQPASADGLDPVSTSLVWLTNDSWPSTLPGREWKGR